VLVKGSKLSTMLRFIEEIIRKDKYVIVEGKGLARLKKKAWSVKSHFIIANVNYALWRKNMPKP